MNFRIINRDREDIDEFKDVKLLRIAVLFGQKVFISNNFHIYTDFENYLLSIRSDPEARLKFQKHYNSFTEGPEDDSWYNSWLFELHRYKREKNRTSDLMLWYMNFQRVVRKLEEISLTYIRSEIDNTCLKDLIELNREEETVIFSTSLAFHDLKPAKRKFDELEEYKFLTGIIKYTDAMTIHDNSIKKTSVFSGAINPETYDGRLMISENPLFSIPEPESLNKEQLKYVRQDFLSSFNILYDFFRDFNSDQESSEAGRLSQCQKQQVACLIENSSHLQKVIDNNLFMTHLRNSFRSEREYKVHLGLCSRDNLIRIYREQKILEESIELSLREQVFRDINLEKSIPFLVVDYDPQWLW